MHWNKIGQVFSYNSNFATINSALSAVLGNCDFLQKNFYFPESDYFTAHLDWNT
jgi:hypothetical protein